MTIFIENTTASTVDLLIQEGKFVKAFAFPGDLRIPIPAGSEAHLIRVPHVEPSEKLGMILSQEAREKIPVDETIGRGFDAYIIESLEAGQGGRVNNVPIEAGSQTNDAEILFIAE